MISIAKNIVFLSFILLCASAFPKTTNDQNDKRGLSWLEFLKQKQEKENKVTAGDSQGGAKWLQYSKQLSSKFSVTSAQYWNALNEEKLKFNALPTYLQDKLLNGEILTPTEEDKFENEYGLYKQRLATTIVDIITTINNADDLTALDEGDVTKLAPPFNYKERKEIESGSNKADDASSVHWERRKRDARLDRVYLWIDRIVPYEIDSALAASTGTIQNALNHIADVSCITFKERTIEKNWIKFVVKSGCWSSVGRTFWTSGFQEISLGTNCVYTGIIIHEVMHALGFWHEQSRPDRDRYVEIFWENILPNEVHNFNKYGYSEADTLSDAYDFKSIMHYGKYSFAVNPQQPTLLSIENPSQDMGQRNELSKTDIRQLNKLYDCNNKGTGWSNWSSFSPCGENCKKSRNRFCMDPEDKNNCPNPLDAVLASSWGIDEEKVLCTYQECNAPVDGHWNKWGSWGSCSVSCDEGVQTRSRSCTDPPPKNGGKSCDDKDSSDVQRCKKRSCNAGPYDCTFDVDNDPSCGWKNDNQNDFDWIRGSGSTPTSSTGPSSDHTSETGHYYFIETSAPARTGYTARFVSGRMSPIPRCMSFAYHMYGQSTGTLSVYVKGVASSTKATAFTKSGNQLNAWHTEKIDIFSRDPYEVIIEAIRGSSFQGDIAIDDITINDGECNGAANPVTTQAPKKPEVKPVGCFYSKGYVNGKRIFPMMKNLRNQIVWEKFKESAESILKQCGEFARESNYEYFAIQYYGECWTGPTDKINYGRDGESEDCWPMPSLNKGPFAVGKDYTAMVYKWV